MSGQSDTECSVPGRILVRFLTGLAAIAALAVLVPAGVAGVSQAPPKPARIGAVHLGNRMESRWASACGSASETWDQMTVESKIENLESEARADKVIRQP